MEKFARDLMGIADAISQTPIGPENSDDDESEEEKEVSHCAQLYRRSRSYDHIQHLLVALPLSIFVRSGEVVVSFERRRVVCRGCLALWF